ncbi:hypothetical protein GC170_12615 [bacterium]|nr:hypothetical protein [bacterium]
MKTVSFTSMYCAGVLAGAGLALFLVFLISGMKGVEFTGPLKTVTGFAGLSMLLVGGFWNIRLQGRSCG